LGRGLAGLMRHGDLPEDVLALGVASADVSPTRFRAI